MSLQHDLPVGADLRDGQIHVWKALLTTEANIAELTKPLDQEEVAQAATFASDKDRLSYVHSHSVLRGVLSLYTGHGAQSIAYERGRHRKPF